MYAYSAGLETRQDVFSLLTGLQWNFLRKPVTPFIGLGLSASSFGALESNIIDDTLMTFKDLNKHTEAGAFLSGGVKMNLNRSLIVKIQARYAIDNLFTRQKHEKNIEIRYIGLNLNYLLK